MTGRAPVAVVMGTRPEAIKLAGLVTGLSGDALVVHTGQHYDAQLWENVQADLPGMHVDEHIHCGGRSRGEQIGMATSEMTRFLSSRDIRAVVVQGDTNSTLAGALAANALGLPLVHVEAGLRSGDRRMPEEINRILVDTLADLCCAPVERNANQLIQERVTPDRIVITGNTLWDAMAMIRPTPQGTAQALDSLNVPPGNYVLATIHRAGTVSDTERLVGLLDGLDALAEQAEVVFPVHPRTSAAIAEAGLSGRWQRIHMVQPLPPSQFMALEAGATLLVSDSGGVQEEACFLRRPLLVLRDSTERPELLDGWCRLLGDQDPAVAIDRAWADARQWGADLATRQLPYPGESASSVIAAEINRRWPA